MLSVGTLHGHVMGLHRTFLEGLPAAGHPTVHAGTLVALQEEPLRSHTLVFAQPSPAAAQAAVAALARQGVLVDSRQACLRIGFGPNHSAADVAALLAALKAAAGG